MLNQLPRILTSQAVTSLRRFLSNTQCCSKSFIIKDHYDFDRKHRLCSYTLKDIKFYILENSSVNIHFSNTTFVVGVINSENPVIVNFHAEWCDPCKILTPKMTELLENSDEIDLAVIDVESNTDLVETFEVKAVPAVLAFRNGVVVDKFIGLVDANSIEILIQKLKPTKNEIDKNDN